MHLAYKVLRWMTALATLALYAGTMTVFIFLSTHGEHLSPANASLPPAIYSSDVVLIKPVNPTALTPGQIVSFRSNSNQNATMIGRLDNVNRTKGQLTAQTGNPLVPEQAIAVNQIKGQIIARIPYVGTALRFLSQPKHLIVAVYAPATAIIYYQVRRIINLSSRWLYHVPGYR